jgi:hypothetical protein
MVVVEGGRAYNTGTLRPYARSMPERHFASRVQRVSHYENKASTSLGARDERDLSRLVRIFSQILLRATSVFSVSLWLLLPGGSNHRDAENTEVARRRAVA